MNLLRVDSFTGKVDLCSGRKLPQVVFHLDGNINTAWILVTKVVYEGGLVFGLDGFRCAVEV